MKRALRTVDIQPAAAAADLAGHGQARHRPAGKRERRRVAVGRVVHRHGRAIGGIERMAVCALRPVRPVKAADPLDAAQRRNERGQVIAAHVVDVAAAGTEGKALFRLLLEIAVAVAALQRDLRGDRLADQAAVDQLNRRLNPRAQERIRRGGELKPLFVRNAHKLARVGERGGEHLFAVHVLARQQRGTVHLKVRHGIRQIDDELDLRIGEDFFIGHLPDAVLLGLGARALLNQVGAADHIEHIELRDHVFEVHVADHAAADDRRFDRPEWFHVVFLLTPRPRQGNPCPPAGAAPEC